MSEEQIAKEFVIWARVPPGYGTRAAIDEDGASICELVKLRQTSKATRQQVIAFRYADVAPTKSGFGVIECHQSTKES